MLLSCSLYTLVMHLCTLWTRVSCCRAKLGPTKPPPLQLHRSHRTHSLMQPSSPCCITCCCHRTDAAAPAIAGMLFFLHAVGCLMLSLKCLAHGPRCPLPLPSLLSMIEKATGGLTFEMTPVDVYFVAERACTSTPAPGSTHHLTVLAIGCTCCATRPSGPSRGTSTRRARCTS